MLFVLVVGCVACLVLGLGFMLCCSLICLCVIVWLWTTVIAVWLMVV